MTKRKSHVILNLCERENLIGFSKKGDNMAFMKRKQSGKLLRNLLLSAVATVGLSTYSYAYDDVLGSDWFEPYVSYVSEQGMMTGVEGDFYPRVSCSREDVAYALAVMSGVDFMEEWNWDYSLYHDLSESNYPQAIAWCSENGIMVGLENGNFNPHGAITREQFAVALLGFSKLEGAYFTPIQTRGVMEDQRWISTWAVAAMTWAIENQMMFGEEGYVSPLKEISRAELAAMLYRYDTTEKSTVINTERLTQFVYSFVGYPYLQGGTNTLGFDCAGLVQYVYLSCGVSLPATVRTLYAEGDTIVSRYDILPGDILFFGTYSHAGIFVGDNQIVHASTPDTGVKISNLAEDYYVKNYAGAKRIV